VRQFENVLYAKKEPLSILASIAPCFWNLRVLPFQEIRATDKRDEKAVRVKTDCGHP